VINCTVCICCITECCWARGFVGFCGGGVGGGVCDVVGEVYVVCFCKALREIILIRRYKRSHQYYYYYYYLQL
jgi:hypothetical protein